MPKGNQIKTLEQLAKARERRVSVTGGFPMFEPSKPAAFVMNLSGEILLRMFRNGLWIYVPDDPNRCRECAGEMGSNFSCLECGYVDMDRYDPGEPDYDAPSSRERTEMLHRHRTEIGR